MAIAEYDTPVVTGVSEDTANVAEALLASVVLVRSNGGTGSGVIWTPDGLIVTNSHVIHNDTADIIFHDGTKRAATLIARDPQHDLAALRVEAHGLPAIKMGDSARVLVGQVVLAVGNPMGMRGVVTAGIVTGVGQITSEGRTHLQDLIQADVALAPGNSGGPLADAEGRVLGINAMIGANGIALAIPSATVQAFLAPQQQNHPYLGIGGIDITVPVHGQTRGGVLMTFVEDGSPADRAGLLQGDILLSFDDQDVQTAQDLLRYLATWPGETPVRLRVQRGADAREFVFMPTLQNEGECAS